MLFRQALLGLPTTLSLLVLMQTGDVLAQKQQKQQQQQQQQQILPLAVRKMSLDESEKFFPERYYAFASSSDETEFAETENNDDIETHGLLTVSSLFSFGRRSPSTRPSRRAGDHDDGRWPLAVRTPTSERRDTPPPDNNTTEAAQDVPFPPSYLPPFSVHQEDRPAAAAASDDEFAWELFRRAADALARLQRRQWGCPTGTTSCEAIGYPYSCCTNGETCYKVEDKGLGPVGCCPSGSTCGGAVLSCPSDSTACPSDLGGGCCIAGYVCAGVGCVRSASASVGSTTSTTTTTSTSVGPTGQPSTVVVTVVITETPGGGLTTRTTTITTEASSLGGTTTTTTTGSSSGTSGGVAPVKPTLTTTQSLPPGFCPTGYYACVASAGGGCCQTGRDCHTTNCPPAAAQSTIVNSNGVTVVVPAAAAAAATSAATCAGGWFLCPDSAGPVAGCCPSGYGCGTASCTLTDSASASSTGEVQKVLPGTSSAAALAAGGRVWWWALVFSLLAVHLR
ncbi:hypothetical protein SPI_00870 [Niveomyces insectorum RCEF 264]|uniref:GPI anchored protein n=1 Tax=Niveomyces insectorum RCEF 264 TaxID=1081102 RepID=A0A168AFL7_9HYPO|nr:hypothetical protein SPI_00870 [Niveomyces insectorum RCEF 264]